MELSNFLLFTSEQGNLLVRFLIAHLLSDFVFQTAGMVKNKRWLSPQMFLHVAVVFVATGLLSNYWIPALVIAVLHYGIDGSKILLQKRFPQHTLRFFLLDQLVHVVVILVVWSQVFNLWTSLSRALLLPIDNYKFSLLLLSYLLITSPIGFVIKFATLNMAQFQDHNEETKPVNMENGGKLIGIFERIIILTFVLLSQYGAIGFLITGKSIIRFADKNSNLKSEYVLVGTMMSYALAILIGLGAKWLLEI